MNVVVKTLKAGQLPSGWQSELGVGPEQSVRIAIEAVAPARDATQTARLLETLATIEPMPCEGDSTEFIRSERDRIDERNRATD